MSDTSTDTPPATPTVSQWLQNILAEIKSIAVGGLSPDQVDAEIDARVKPHFDTIDTTLTNIQTEADAVTNDEKDDKAAIQAITDHLDGIDTTTVPPAPTGDAGAAGDDKAAS